MPLDRNNSLSVAVGGRAAVMALLVPVIYIFAGETGNQWFYLLAGGAVAAMILAFCLPLMQVLGLDATCSVPTSAVNGENVLVKVSLKRRWGSVLLKQLVPVKWLVIRSNLISHLGQSSVVRPLIVESVEGESSRVRSITDLTTLEGTLGIPQQALVLRLDRRVAFAGDRAEAGGIGNLDITATVADAVFLLQRMRDDRDAVAARTDHLSHHFLRHHEAVAAGQVPHFQQPAREPGFHGVHGLAGHRLLGLDYDGLSVSGDSLAQGCAMLGRRPQPIQLHDRREAG